MVGPPVMLEYNHVHRGAACGLKNDVVVMVIGSFTSLT